MPSKLEMRQDAEFTRMLRGAWVTMERLTRFMDEGTKDDVIIKELRVQGPHVTGDEYRVIVKGMLDGAPLVAFHSGPNMANLLEGLAARIDAGTLRWRDDEPYATRTAGGKGPRGSDVTGG